MAKKAAVSKEIVHPEFKYDLFRGEGSLTVEKAIDLLGWEELDAKDASALPELYEIFGKRIRLIRCLKNRFITPSHVRMLCQEILNNKWRFNSIPIIVDTYNQVINGQHRLLALILAGVRWADKDDDQVDQWRKNWKEEPTIETVVNYGVENDDDTFATISQDKPATLAEFLYRTDILKGVKVAHRKTYAKMLDWSVKLLWDRCSLKYDAFAPVQTLTESKDFLDRHPTLHKKAVGFIYEENIPGQDEKGNKLADKIGQWIHPGYATALLYLMGTSSSDRAKYLEAKEQNEKSLDFSRWDRAEEFWMSLAGRLDDTEVVRSVLAGLKDPITGKKGGTFKEKTSVLALAWQKYAVKESVTAKDLKLKYEPESRVVKDPAQFGGIDNGSAKPIEEEEEKENPNPTPEEIEEKKKLEKRKKAEDLAKKMAERKKAKKDAEKNKLKESNGEAPKPEEEGREGELEEVPEDSLDAVMP